MGPGDAARQGGSHEGLTATTVPLATLLGHSRECGARGRFLGPPLSAIIPSSSANRFALCLDARTTATASSQGLSIMLRGRRRPDASICFSNSHGAPVSRLVEIKPQSRYPAGIVTP
jgi:hypothetical protein